MDTTRIGPELYEVIKLSYHANRPLLVAGRHGIGKSEQIEQAAHTLGIDYKCVDLSIMEPTDLIGLPTIVKNRTEYAAPSWLPSSGRGILMFEELNRCERYMLAPCLQILTARRLNDYELPPGWLPMAAVNPSGDAGYDVNELDPALRSRFSVINVVPGHAAWLDWAEENEIHPAVIRYVASDDSIFDFPGTDPRSWHAVSESVKAYERHDAPVHALRSLIIGDVGLEHGAAFMASLTNDARPLSVAEVLDTYAEHRKQLKGWVRREGRLDLVDVTLRCMLKHLQPHEEYQDVFDDQKRWRNLQTFLHDLPGDLHDVARAYFDDRDYTFPEPPRRTKRKGSR